MRERTDRGFGVTAHSLEDAHQILHAFGYGIWDFETWEATEVLDGAGLRVAASMGPMNVRGIWYPFTTVGVPR